MGTSRLLTLGLLSLLLVGAACTSTAGGAASTCSPNSGGAFSSCTATGYSCTGTDAPDKSTPSLACSVGSPGPMGSMLYCCLKGSFSTSTCAPSHAVSGCNGDSYGFSCAGSNTPDQIDSTLSCNARGSGSGGATLFCCTTGATTPPPSPCMQDSTLTCNSGAVGYSCTGTDTPNQPTLICATGSPAGGGKTGYCCVDYSSSNCKPDLALQGCVAGSFGFRCTGSSTPSATDPSVICSTGTAGLGGVTSYCCMN
jgi:hypothetical protein